MEMEWTKIPTDLLQSRKSDKEIIAIVKYQLLWAMLERKPNDDIALRYMTNNQLQQANEYMSSIERCVSADIKSVESNRKRQKIFYDKKQTLSEKPNGYTNEYPNDNSNAQANDTDKIREDKIREDKIKRFVKPSIAEISEYCNERKNNIDAVSFYDFYESKGWKIGNSPMKDWKASVRTWERSRQQKNRNMFCNSDGVPY